MEISATRLDRIVTQVGSVPIDFYNEFLNNLLGISNDGHKIYTSRKALSFDSFVYCEGVVISVTVESLLLTFVVYLFALNYCLSKFASFTLFYSISLHLGRVIRMRSHGWMLGY